MPVPPYDLLARYYDLLFDRTDGVRRARTALFGQRLPRVNSACDLACGTGNLAIDLAQRGIRTYAVDLSPAMCDIARRKARKAKVPVQVIEADMRAFRLPEGVDLITCEFDALNHLPRKTDLRRVLKRVVAALKPGGHFAFDVLNRQAFEQIWAHTWFLQNGPVALVMQGEHVQGTDRAAMNLEWFVEAAGKNLWRRYQERVEEVCWSAAEMEHAVAEAGLEIVKNLDAAPLFREALTVPGNRTYWLTQKPPQHEPERKALPASAQSARSRAGRQ